MLGDRDATGLGPLALLLATMLLTVTAAGCIGEDDGSGTTEEPPSASPDEDANETSTELPWGFSGCKTVVAIVPVDEAALAEHLPEGFTPRSAEEALGLPPDPRGEGAIGLETFACPSAVGLQGPLEDIAYGAVFSPVEPPSNLSHPDADVVFYKWSTLVPDDPRRQALADEGLPVVDGSTDLSGLQQTPTGAHTFDVSLTLGNATFTFQGGAGQPNEDFRNGLPFVEFQEANGGFAYWASLSNEAAGANSGTGTLGLDPGHWTSDVVGSETTQAFMVASTNVTFEQASITLP